MYLFDLQDVLGGAMQGRVGAKGGKWSSLANLGHFSPQIRDFSHLHQPQLESLSPNYSLQNSTFISQEFKTYFSDNLQQLKLEAFYHIHWSVQIRTVIPTCCHVLFKILSSVIYQAYE